MQIHTLQYDVSRGSICFRTVSQIFPPTIRRLSSLPQEYLTSFSHEHSSKAKAGVDNVSQHWNLITQQRKRLLKKGETRNVRRSRNYCSSSAIVTLRKNALYPRFCIHNTYIFDTGILLQRLNSSKSYEMTAEPPPSDI